MAPLTFADTHNMIAFLTKSDASEEFDQIVDFLNAHTIQYALMVNPPIYVSCIKQFWAFVSIKKSNDAVKLRIGKGFSGVDTPLFDNMLVQQQVQDDAEVEEDEDDNEVPAAPSSPTTVTTLPPQQAHIPSSPQAQSAQPSSPPQQQPSQIANISESSMTILNTLMKTCATLTQKVANLEQDKIAQALEITKLKQRVGKLEKKRQFKSSGLKRLKKVGTAHRVKSLNDIVVDDQEDASKQGGRMEEDITAVKDINAAESEPTVFDDEKVTMSMAQTLIKMKAKKARILDEQMEKRLQDEEIEQVAARERQEKEDLKRAKVLQQQYDQKQEDIDWNIVADQMQEKHLDNVKKYQSLKRIPISIAQARKNMIVYLKNMAGYKIQHFNGMTYDQKRVAKETLLQESFKKLRAEVEVSGSRTYWRMIRVGGVTQEFQNFEGMLKDFDREDLDALWRITKEKFSTALPTQNKEKALWAELTRLYEPNANDVFWKLQRYMHYPIMWKLHSNSGVHQVFSTTRRYDIYMLAEKDYPLSNQVMTLMLSSRLQVEEDTEVARDLSTSVGNKMHKAFPLPVTEFPLPEEVPTAREESSHCQKKREATAVKIALLLKSKKKLSVKVR
nr:hypothetical protein [Tanacetum cinerariifolium]